MKSNLAKLNIKEIPLKDLDFWKRNPRDISPDDFERLKRDLVRYTMLNPLTVDGRDNKTVLGGNMRLKALRELAKEYKIDTVTCNVVEVKDDKEAILIALKDNEAFGRYIEEELKILTLDIEEAQEIKVSLHPLEIRDLQDWSEGLNNAENGSEEELEDFLKESEENAVIKIMTKKQYADKVMEILDEYCSQHDIEDKGLALNELLEQKKYEALPEQFSTKKS